MTDTPSSTRRRVRLSTSGSLSNRKYHAFGKPDWWVRFEDKDRNFLGFLDFDLLSCGPIRADRPMNLTLWVPGKVVPEGTYRICMGSGPRTGGYRETVVARDLPDAEVTP